MHADDTNCTVVKNGIVMVSGTGPATGGEHSSPQANTAAAFSKPLRIRGSSHAFTLVFPSGSRQIPVT